MLKVDFFIAGAPKCGTTAMVDGLRQNPHILFSSSKEPHYFSTDLLYNRVKPQSDAEYLQTYFPAQKQPGSFWGDASVWHLFSDVALGAIRAFNPDARIIVMLRDPARAAFAMHQMRRFQSHDKVRSFTEAWTQSQERFDRLGFDGFTDTVRSDPRLGAYRHAFAFHSQLVRLYQTFPAEQILIVQQEIFARDSINTLRQVSDFIGAAPFDFTEAKRSNANLYLKDSIFIDMLHNATVRKSTAFIKKVFGFKSFGVGRPTVRATPAELALVHRDLAEDIAAVRRDFGIDLLNSKAAA